MFGGLRWKNREIPALSTGNSCLLRLFFSREFPGNLVSPGSPLTISGIRINSWVLGLVWLHSRREFLWEKKEQILAQSGNSQS